MNFKRESLFASYKVNDIATRNSLFFNSHQKSCETIDAERKRILDKFRKTRRQFEQRLARHAQDSLSMNDLKDLQKYVDDNRDEKQFCRGFRTVRKSTLGTAKRLSDTSAKQLLAQKNGNEDLDKMNNNTIVKEFQWLDIKGVGKVTKLEKKNSEIDKNVTSEFTEDKGQAKIKDYRGTLSKANIPLPNHNDKKDNGLSNVPENKPDNRELLKVPVLSPKKLSPIPQESEDGEHQEGIKNNETELDNANSFDNAEKNILQLDNPKCENLLKDGQKHIMMNYGARRSISLDEGTKLQEKISSAVYLNKSEQEIPRSVNRRQSVAGIGLAAQQKPNRLLRRQSLDVSALHGKDFDWRGSNSSFDQKERRQSVVKVYSEEPFYVRRQKQLTRRMSWQSNILPPETLKKLQAIADKSAAEQKVQEEEETPLDELLPPITLPAIHSHSAGQRSDREKLQMRARLRSQTTRLSDEQLTRRLKDCRYLRIPVRR